MTYKSIAEIKAANEAAGQSWFAPDTLAWHESIIEPEVYGGRFFVTSERDKTGLAWDGKRRWTVRRANDDGTIDTMGEYGQFASKARASMRAQGLVMAVLHGEDADEVATRLAEQNPRGNE